MNKLKVVLPAIALFFAVNPVLAVVDSTAPAVDIANPPSVINKTEFTISFTALDAGSGLRDVTLLYHREGQSWQTLQTYTTTSGKFAINSTHTIQDTKYYFQATACDNSGNCATDETSTTLDRVAPPKPEGFGKNRTSSNNYHLRWHNADSTDVYQVYIYRSTTPGFTADSGTQVGTVNVTKNTDTDWDNSVPADGKDYYYLARSVDQAGNASDVVGDIQVITTTVETTGTNGQPVSGSEALAGQQLVAKQGSVLGDATQPESPATENTSPDPAETVAQLNPNTEEAPNLLQKTSSLTLILGILGLAAAIYFFVFKKK